MSATPPPVPRRTATLGMLLFLASLTMLFGASLLAYFVIRFLAANSPPLHVLKFPPVLWISTVLIVASSFTIARALSAVRIERQKKLRLNLWLTLLLSLGFIAIQAPALVELLRQHQQLAETGLRLYGLLFFLILLHAAHVIGGLVMLFIVIAGAQQNRYDHEHYVGVRNLAFYWHFLDGVWLVMFLSLWGVG